MRPSPKSTISAEAVLPLDQPHVTGARALLRFFRSEFDTLAFAQQLEHRPANRAAMEEVFDAAFVSNEAEPLVNEEACDCPGWHIRSPPFSPGGYPTGAQPVTGVCQNGRSSRRGAGRVFQLLAQLESGPV